MSSMGKEVPDEMVMVVVVTTSNDEVMMMVVVAMPNDEVMMMVVVANQHQVVLRYLLRSALIHRLKHRDGVRDRLKQFVE